MCRWIGRVIFFCCIVSMSGCGGPFTNQMSDAVYNNLPNIGASDASIPSAPKAPACVAQNVHALDIYFATPVCTQYYLGSGKWYTADEVDSAPDNLKLQIEFVSDALEDSRNKCQAFIGQFTIGESGESTFLDVTSLILSGLGSVFTPANTVRALSAASTAVQGTKQAINSDLYQQMTMLLLVQQIQTSYYNVMDAQFPSVPPPSSIMSNFTASAALVKIEDIHRNCSLPFSAASLQAKAAQPASPAISAAPKSQVIIKGKVTPGDVISLTPKGSEDGLNLPVTYTVAKSDKSLGDVANGLQKAIYNDGALARLGISAQPGSLSDQSAGSVAFTLQGGPTDLTWGTATVSGSASETVTIAVSSAGT